MSITHRPRCPLTLVIEECSFLVQGHCLHACWSGQSCPAAKVPPDQFQQWQSFDATRDSVARQSDPVIELVDVLG